MMFSVNAEQWATETFSDAELGDLRRIKRLVKITTSLANHIGQSIVQPLESAADIEAAYLPPTLSLAGHSQAFFPAVAGVERLIFLGVNSRKNTTGFLRITATRT